MRASELVLFEGACLADAPFPHALLVDCLDPDLETTLLDWMMHEARWERVNTDFYHQDEVSLLDVPLPMQLQSLVHGASLASVRRQIQQLFNVRLSEKVTVVAHRLSSGDRIGIHNDYIQGAETHRLTIQINKGLQDEDGGLFMLFNSADPTDVHQVLRPLSRSGIAFEIGPQSFHAVSTVHGGERYTLVYSFFTS